MPDILFHVPTRVVFGLDTVNRIGQLAAEYGERAFLVTEAILYEGKVINRVQDILDKKGMQHIVFDEVVPNATSRTVDDWVTLARGAHADVVIGLGGDSAGGKPCPTKKQKNPLDSDRPSHGRRFHQLAPFVRQNPRSMSVTAMLRQLSGLACYTERLGAIG